MVMHADTISARVTTSPRASLRPGRPASRVCHSTYLAHPSFPLPASFDRRRVATCHVVTPFVFLSPALIAVPAAKTSTDSFQHAALGDYSSTLRLYSPKSPSTILPPIPRCLRPRLGSMRVTPLLITLLLYA